MSQSRTIRPLLTLQCFGHTDTGVHVYYTSDALVVHNIAEPNWEVTAVLGAVLAALVVPFWQLLNYPVRRLRPHSLNGQWYTYHLTFVSGQIQLRFGILHIRPGIRSRYVATRENSDAPPQSDGTIPAPKLRHKGQILPDEADQIVILYKGTSHRETVVYRFLNRIPSNATVVPGIWIGYDHDLCPAAGSAILSRKALPPDEAIRILQSWLVCERGAIHLRKNPIARRSGPARNLSITWPMRKIHPIAL
jgi:hypothetical protein